MQARVYGFERKDKQAQTVFQGDQTNDHFSPCEGPILFWSSFFVSLHFKSTHFFLFFSFHFPFSFLFQVSFLALLLFFCSLIFFQWCELNTFGTPFFTFAFQHQAFDRLSLREDFFLSLPPSVEGDPWSGYRRKFIRLKRVTTDNFHISDGMMKDGHLLS